MEDLEDCREKRLGMVYALLAYVAWGLLPLYWKMLQQVPADQILAHRIFWSFIFVGLIVCFYGSWQRVKATLTNKKHLMVVVLCAIIISANWFTYIWAVNANHVVEASMGYYINPLITVLLGVVVLKEKLSGLKWAAVALAGLGVGILAVQYGKIPWVALILAVTFAFYGLTKKMLQVDSVTGLFLETAVIAPLALGYILLKQSQGIGVMGTVGMPITLLLLGSGIATATPLLFFALGAKRVELTTMGFLQYIAPTISLYLGVIVFREEFTKIHLISFGCIWCALAIYSMANVRFSKQLQPSLQREG